MTRLRIWQFLAIMLAALSLGPSYAHVLEAVPRLSEWAPELWREATVFAGQFRYFALIGAPVEIGTIVTAGILAVLSRRLRGVFAFALAGCLLYALSLAVWAAWVAPANAILATWQPGPIPPEFDAVRLRWESGHMAVAALKLLGLGAIVISTLRDRR
ncbi:DUF1772 domain-containing protein [Bosea sp. CS1GBMeth4]|uniref:DUF1772 domain-containing protein n=1 Tax=Bosea sp. CS1GBMeth4 TaxID=1892849 RepID=UPI00164892E3|nr:DUF1772 domain-containing protein [Bosea sp. CS1GBMeth4]